MRLREIPDDFVVEEVPSVDIKPKGKYPVFRLSKVNMTTFAAEKVLAKRCGVNFKRIGVAGLKDTHARTSQFFSVETDDPQKGVFEEKNVKSELAGFSDEMLKTGSLKGNKFTIAIRALRDGEIERAQKNVDWVKKGVPNYFDSQRFGSLKGTDGFIAKDVLRGEVEEAVKKVVTATNRHQKAKVRNARKFILAHWGAWALCEGYLRKEGLERTGEMSIVSHLAKNPKDFDGALDKVFGGVRELFFSSYQAYIWNECVMRLIKQTSKSFFSVKYEAGSLFFARQLSLSGTFPLIAGDMRTSKENMDIIKSVLKVEDMKLEDFFTSKYSFIARERDLVVVPEGLSFEVKDDERHKGFKKVVVSFYLQKGSYATVVLKSLFEM